MNDTPQKVIETVNQMNAALALMTREERVAAILEGAAEEMERLGLHEQARIYRELLGI